MFQYAALERNNTTEPLGGRKRCRLAPQADSAPNLNSYSIVHPAGRNAAASLCCWPLRRGLELQHLLWRSSRIRRKTLSKRYKSITKMRYGLSLCRAQYTEEPRFKEGKSSRCTSSPPNFSFSSPAKCCNSPASYKHIFHQYGLLSKHSPPAYSVARWKDMLIYLKLQGVTCQSWGGAPFLLHKVGDDQKIYTKF